METLDPRKKYENTPLAVSIVSCSVRLYLLLTFCASCGYRLEDDVKLPRLRKVISRRTAAEYSTGCAAKLAYTYITTTNTYSQFGYEFVLYFHVNSIKLLK